jgi:hypothetical protein
MPFHGFNPSLKGQVITPMRNNNWKIETSVLGGSQTATPSKFGEVMYTYP